MAEGNGTALAVRDNGTEITHASAGGLALSFNDMLQRVISTGYNGVPEGREHCPDIPEHMALEHCQAAIHAEYNALANALVPAFGATLYVVGPRPVCPDCRDRLRENGVTDIRWRESVEAPTVSSISMHMSSQPARAERGAP